MKHIIFVFSFFVALLLCASETISAQWLPERRLIRQGNREYSAGNYLDAEVKYRKALEKMEEDSGQAYNISVFNLSDAVYKQERYEEAEQYYIQLAQDSVETEHSAKAYYNAANAMVQQNKLEEALEAYKNAMRRDPGDQDAKFNYAYVKKLLEKNNEENQDQQQNQNQDQDKNEGNDQGNDDDSKGEQKNNEQQKKGQDDVPDSDQSENNPDNQKDNDENKDDGDNGQNPDKSPSGQNQNQQGQAQSPMGLSKEDADKMLEAEQMNEDKTREKMGAKKGAGVAASGKNW